MRCDGELKPTLASDRYRMEHQHVAKCNSMGGDVTATPKNRMGKKPDGTEIMKRRAPRYLSLRPAKFELDPEKAYSTEQLAKIGAITLKWNQIEGHIDFSGSHILFANAPFWLRISTDRTLSTKKKLGLLKDCVKYAEFFDDPAKRCIEDCFSQIEQCGAYRNAIIHHHIYDHEKGIGSYVDESNSAYQILVSIEALKILYEIMCALLTELREIDMMFRTETGAQRPGEIDPVTQEFKELSSSDLKQTIIPQHTHRLTAWQKSRRELQKLPRFPDADLIRALNEKEDDRGTGP